MRMGPRPNLSSQIRSDMIVGGDRVQARFLALRFCCMYERKTAFMRR